MRAIDTTPGYTNTFLQPTAHTKWKYKDIYRVADQQVDLWRQVMSTVGG